MDGADPAMMEKLMAALGKSGEGGEGGMDIASMMASMGGMGGMGGGPEASQQQVAQKNQADLAAKNAGEVEGGSDGKKYKCVAGATVRTCVAPRTSRTLPGHITGDPLPSLLRRYEQTSKYGDSEIIVRFALQTPAAKKDVKVVFKAATLSVAVHGVPPPAYARAVRGLVSGRGAAKLRDQTLTPSLTLTRRGAAQRQALRNRPDGRLHVVPRREGLRAAGDARAHGGHEMAGPDGTGGVRVDPLCAHGGPHEMAGPDGTGGVRE